MRRCFLLGVLLLCGCVYYNGMYNTKRLAGSARRAEREGRPFEASNLWGQVITRAETLVVRHPESKYADEALVYKGIALSRLGQCPAAMTPLARASVLELDREISEEATLALGRCRLELGDPGAAGLAFAQVIESDDPARRRDAKVLYARALRQSGRSEEAISALDGVTDPRAPRERLLALAGTRRNNAALALADSMLAVNDSAPPWDSVLTAVGESNPPLASSLVDHLAGRPSTTPAQHARRLLEDAGRLESLDSARAAARLREAAKVGAGTESGERAHLRLVRLDISRATWMGELAPLADTLDRLAGASSAVGAEAHSLAAKLGTVRQAVDSSAPDVPQGDLRLFLAAEIARDSLRAPQVATALFRQLVETWPSSPYAPKALLAGRALDPVWGEQVEGLLHDRYAGSPYLAFVRGEDPVGYLELEDSLNTYALSAAAGPPRPRAPAPETRRAGDAVAPTPGARPGAGQRQPTTAPGRPEP